MYAFLAIATAVPGLAAHAVVDAPLVDLAIRRHVAEAVGVADHDVEVVHNGLGAPLSCGPAAKLEVVAAASETYREHVNLRVRGTERGEICADLRVRARLRVWQEVPVAAVATAPGDTVRLSSRRVLRHELTGPVVSSDARRLEAIAPLRAGQPVFVSRVRAIPDARSGDTVTLLAGRQGITIRATGRLLHDASIGDRVRVASTATGSVVVGTLKEDGLVQAQGAER